MYGHIVVSSQKFEKSSTINHNKLFKIHVYLEDTVLYPVVCHAA